MSKKISREKIVLFHCSAFFFFLFLHSTQPNSCCTAELRRDLCAKKKTKKKTHPRLGGNEGSLDGRAGRWRDLGAVRFDSSERGGAPRPAAAICASHGNPRDMYATATGGGLDKWRHVTYVTFIPISCSAGASSFHVHGSE